MFEEHLLEVMVSLASSFLAFRYTEKFLYLKAGQRKRALALWLALYVAGLGLWGQAVEGFMPQAQQSIYGSMANLMAGALLMMVLQRGIFVNNLSRQFFVVVSFWAGWGILKFAASPLAHVLLDVWGPLWQYLLEVALAREVLPAQSLLAMLEAVNRAAVFVVLFFCRLVQLALLALCLYLISRHLLPRDYELKPQESFFLLMPCLTALVIDLTFRTRQATPSRTLSCTKPGSRQGRRA